MSGRKTQHSRINFYRPHDSFHTPVLSPRPHKSQRTRGRKESCLHSHRSLYEVCLSKLVLYSDQLIILINRLPEPLLCDFYGAMHQFNRSCANPVYERILANQLSDISLLNRLLNAEHRRSILYGPIQVLCCDTRDYLSQLVVSFSHLCQSEMAHPTESLLVYWVTCGARLGQLLQEMGWYRSASLIIRTVFDLIDGEASYRRKEMFVETGSRLMHCLSCDCQFPEAQELESRCIQYISDLTSANYQIPNIAVVYARLAALNDILCNYSVARRWALKALECVSLQLPVKSIVFVFGQASKSCVVSKKFRKAESIARGAVNISSLYCGTNDPVYSDALMHLGYCNLSIDLTSAAVTCFEKKKKKKKRMRANRRVKVNQGRRKTPFKQGRPFWQREGIMVGAVDLWETDMDPQGPMTSTPPTCHEDLAYSLYVKNYLEGNFSGALKHAEMSIYTFLSSLGSDHLITASARRVKALIQEEIAIDSKDLTKRKKLLNEALQLHLGSLELTMKAFGEDSVPTAKHYGNLGRLYQSLKQFQKAEGYHKDAIRIKEKHLGPDDYEVGLSVGHLAALYCYDMEEFLLAEPLYFRSIHIGLKLFGEGFSGLEFDYRGLIHLYKKTGDFAHQMKFMSKFDDYRSKRDQVSKKGATKEDREPLTLLDTLEVLQSETQGAEQTMDTSESILNYILSQD